ncbi:MAG: hypothetical protein A2W98_10760 [Bacteroidetes bacterium GWF2_33_38]|nr:MAG: hypothetical protein A2W98_10760 [Bacteroidetes bacterium GWF2_33_38]OFY76291.1 MAG: hypothetical protein A2265_08005 [Bacteroidetes bacterium RIFOXYA12_FULL_33_9]OFY89713.1 MAG: hypothetical protein A2236_09780 [Bacteroidetes bacterium RIFOXYA2_FULL_33_7]
MRFLTKLIFILSPIFSFGQCFEKNIAFQEGELITYSVSYNWGFLWVNAGEAYFKVDSTIYNGRKAYFIDSYGTTFKEYDWIFKVRDRYQAIVDKETLRPLKFSRDVYEGGLKIDEKYVYDYSKNLIYSDIEKSKEPRITDTLKLSPCTFDVLSMIYFARNLDFSKYKVGDKIPISLIIDNSVYDLYIRYQGKEIVETRTGQKFPCIKFTPLLVEGTIFSGGEEMTAWVTDDDNKIPIFIEANILVGYIKVYISGLKGLRNKGSKK